MIHYNFGIVLQENFKDFSNARRAYERAIQLKSDSNFHHKLGILLVNNFKDFAGARDEFEKAISINSNDAKYWRFQRTWFVVQEE